MDANLLQAIFTDETKAREWLESQVWPDGPVCPHCGADRDKITALRGKAHRPGVYQCNACREQFTVTVKTVFEKSKDCHDCNHRGHRSRLSARSL